MSRRIGITLLGLAALAIVAILTFRRPQEDKRPAPDAVGSGDVFINNFDLGDSGLDLTYQATGEIADATSLAQMKSAIEQRGPGALARLREELAELESKGAGPSMAIARSHCRIGTVLIYLGHLAEAEKELKQAQSVGNDAGMPVGDQNNLEVLLGIVALRRGEVENCIGCVGPSSCILPIAGEAIHKKQSGSREALARFTKALELTPGDLRIRWVLNIAAMTLGEYPESVPQTYRIPIDTFDSTVEMGRFENVAPLVGLTARGPNQAGGSIFDDFTGDGLPDLFVTSIDADRGASLFVNRGNGTFEDRSQAAGLDEQVYALNVARADFDNDGNLDVVLLRGGWEKALRMSLLRNRGDGIFEDVTIASGLAEPIASESAAWGDFDNDGLIDLFVCGEYRPPFGPLGDGPPPDPRNRCRLYKNQGGGKFVDVAKAAGVAEEQCSKGSAWGDYDGDGYLDLYVSNMNAPCRLYHNERNGTFRDVARQLHVDGPKRPFACWFWDYDNDGRLDLYVNDYSSSLARFAADSLKMAGGEANAPCLYRNVGAAGFRNVTADVGLNRGMLPMGCNFGDVDNDGFLDFYLGTGKMAIEFLVPNLLFRNDGGKRFDDVTTISGTGHLQKGHGISFADWDCDGDLDLFVEAGGGIPGDRAYNVLFENPGNGNHWLKVRLTGSKTNRAALGARIKVTLSDAEGKSRTIYRTVGNNGSFGGNSLVESIGLRDSSKVDELEIYWPTSQTTQTFRDLDGDRAIEITEGIDEARPYPQPWRS